MAQAARFRRAIQQYLHGCVAVQAVGVGVAVFNLLISRDPVTASGSPWAGAEGADVHALRRLVRFINGSRQETAIGSHERYGNTGLCQRVPQVWTLYLIAGVEEAIRVRFDDLSHFGTVIALLHRDLDLSNYLRTLGVQVVGHGCCQANAVGIVVVQHRHPPGAQGINHKSGIYLGLYCVVGIDAEEIGIALLRQAHFAGGGGNNDDG